MKTIWKILIFVGALWFIGSAMTAAPSTPDMNNLNMPIGWEHAMADGNYANTIKGGHLLVSELENDTLNDYMTNNTTDEYYVTDISGNGTMYSYTWGVMNQGGYFEVVHVNGTDYMLTHSFTDSELESYEVGDIWGTDLLKQINELNGLEPVQI